MNIHEQIKRDSKIVNVGIGLGDLVGFVTKWTGVAFVVGRATRNKPGGCGCAQRRNAWNLVRITWPIHYAGVFREREDGSRILPPRKRTSG